MDLTQRELELVGMSDVELVAHTYHLANRCQTDEVMDDHFSTLCVSSLARERAADLPGSHSLDIDSSYA
jgi:hypothetical protein